MSFKQYRLSVMNEVAGDTVLCRCWFFFYSGGSHKAPSFFVDKEIRTSLGDDDAFIGGHPRWP